METPSRAAGQGRGWYFAFFLSWIGILVIPFYNAAEPTLGGFPFFYWYQFALVVVSAAITWVVYLATPQTDDSTAEETL